MTVKIEPATDEEVESIRHALREGSMPCQRYFASLINRVDYEREHANANHTATLATAAERDALAAQVAALRGALEQIAVYGCGMLNQPAELNGPEEAWLRKRIAEYERVAGAALAQTRGTP